MHLGKFLGLWRLHGSDRADLRYPNALPRAALLNEHAPSSGYTPYPNVTSCDTLCAVSYRSINPFNYELVQRFDEHTDEELETAIRTAVTCYGSWRHLTFNERTSIVAKAAAIMRERADELARFVSLEMGKLLAESHGEVTLSADILDYCAQQAEKLESSSGEAVVQNSPLGVLFGVQPWNFPYDQLARFAAPNLMAGNVVMVKHSATVAQCAIAFEQLWSEAGAPAGAYTNLLISHE